VLLHSRQLQTRGSQRCPHRMTPQPMLYQGMPGDAVSHYLHHLQNSSNTSWHQTAYRTQQHQNEAPEALPKAAVLAKLRSAAHPKSSARLMPPSPGLPRGLVRSLALPHSDSSWCVLTAAVIQLHDTSFGCSTALTQSHRWQGYHGATISLSA
jgi:hypothetical protein